LIVFVDDLDRCLPEKGIEVLEAIKLFLEVPGVVFVLGMDREVVQRGIEARYGHFFQRQVGQREELPIRGDVYLQKIVQIPFYLPALAISDLDKFMAGLDKGLSDMTRQVFAHGLFPNPRQVKRALNIFRLLQQIARAREKRPAEEGGLPPGSIAWPLLAKTVVIQTQHSELYQLWRQYPTVVQTLEEEYGRRMSSEKETLLGRRRAMARPEAGVEVSGEEREETAQEGERSGGLLDEYVGKRQQYGLLAQMLAYPPEEESGEGRERARFAGLGREALAAYVRLAGTVESEGDIPVDLPADLLQELLSNEPVRILDAASRLQSEEPERDGQQHQAARTQLVSVLQDAAQPVAARLSAGEALAAVGDSRFRAEAWHLADEPLLGFVEIPGGEFLMGSDKDQDGQARDVELPQHTVTLPAYYMARYPVTVAQFRVFVEDSGRELQHNKALEGPENHPVRFVTWHEALAYCKWLTEALRSWKETPQALRSVLNPGQNGERPWRVILPSEAEWEKAARGEKGLIYPWGDSFEGERANYKGSGIDNSSAVGCFPGGAAPLGLLDMSGNVWEWTRSLLGTGSEPAYKYPYDPGDGREDLQKEDKWLRVVRGGSAWSEKDRLRCASRVRYPPNGDYGHVGFRVVVSPFFNSDL
jgi:formylglycine-generating enzyme required for sulfatase activity